VKFPWFPFDFYQLVLRLLYIFHVCLSICLCFPTYHVCNNYVTYMLPCNFTLVDLTAALSTGVCTMSSPAAQLQVCLKLRYRAAEATCICDDVRLTEHGNARSEQIIMMPTEQLIDRPRRVLEWVQRPGWISRCEISDLFSVCLCFAWRQIITNVHDLNGLLQPCDNCVHVCTLT